QCNDLWEGDLRYVIGRQLAFTRRSPRPPALTVRGRSGVTSGPNFRRAVAPPDFWASCPHVASPGRERTGRPAGPPGRPAKLDPLASPTPSQPLPIDAAEPWQRL